MRWPGPERQQWRPKDAADLGDAHHQGLCGDPVSETHITEGFVEPLHPEEAGLEKGSHEAARGGQSQEERVSEIFLGVREAHITGITLEALQVCDEQQRSS